MSIIKDRMIEFQQEIIRRKIADRLGISYYDLSELDYEIDTDESEDGLIYSYIIKFSDSSPLETLKKIKGIEDLKRIYIQPFG